MRHLIFGKYSRIILLSIFVFAIAFYGIWVDKVYFTDELYIQDASYTMYSDKNIFVPKVGGVADITKPPLVYWSVVPFYYFLRPGVLDRKIPAAVFGVLLAFLLYKFSKKFYNESVTFMSVLFLTTSYLFVYFTKFNNFDLPNTFFILLMLYFYNLEKKSKGNIFLSAIVFSLALLTRSYLALISFIIVLYDLIFISQSKYKTKFILIYLTTSFFIVGAWFLPTYIFHHAAVQNDLVMVSVKYLIGQLPGEPTQNIAIYLSYLWLMPSSLLAFFYISSNRKNFSRIDKQLIIWVLVFFVVLFFAKTKHVWYAFPTTIPVSVLSARGFSLLQNKYKRDIYKTYFINISAIFILLFYPVYYLRYGFSEVGIVKALKAAQLNTKENDTIFIWKFPLFKQTSFFPKRNIKIINSENLENVLSINKNIVVVFLKGDEVGEKITRVRLYSDDGLEVDRIIKD